MLSAPVKHSDQLTLAFAHIFANLFDVINSEKPYAWLAAVACVYEVQNVLRPRYRQLVVRRFVAEANLLKKVKL